LAMLAWRLTGGAASLYKGGGAGSR
jgi:hypothetical protein